VQGVSNTGNLKNVDVKGNVGHFVSKGKQKYCAKNYQPTEQTILLTKGCLGQRLWEKI
jgi:hypothetical protein